MDRELVIRLAAICGASALIFLIWIPLFVPASFFAALGAGYGYRLLWKQSRPYDAESLPNIRIRDGINRNFKFVRKAGGWWLGAAFLFSVFAWSGGTSGNAASRAIGSFALALSVYAMIYMAANAASMKKLRLDVKGRMEEETNARKS